MGLKGDFPRSDVTNRGPAPMVARSLSALLQRELRILNRAAWGVFVG